MGERGATIAVVARNEEARILACLESVIAPEIPSFPIEILVVDNLSKDSTVFQVERFARNHPDFRSMIRVIKMSENHLGRARAEAVRQARYDRIAFIDADCAAPMGWLNRLMSAFDAQASGSSGISAVGSGNWPQSSPLIFHRALQVFLSSFLGGLNTVQAWPLAMGGDIPHLPTCNVLYDRRMVLECGNFSKNFGRVCEDVELSLRLRKKGGRIFYEPGIEVIHHHRESLLHWARKMFRYGWGQMHVTALHPTHLFGVKILPLLVGAGGVTLIAFRPALAAWFAGFYLALILLYSALQIRKREEKMILLPQLAAFYAITHFSYAAGEMVGLGLVPFWWTQQTVQRAVRLAGSGRALRETPS